MTKPLVNEGWISLEEASQKYGQEQKSFYLWEEQGLLRLRRLLVGEPNVFVDEVELITLLRDREALNTKALQDLWDNDVDAIYDAIDWRTGQGAAS